jgi:hypothetical protein
MGGISSRDAVGLPDIHLGAAGAHITNATVRVLLGGAPSNSVGLFHTSQR